MSTLMLNFDKKENQNMFDAVKPSQTKSNANPVPKMGSFRTVTEKSGKSEKDRHLVQNIKRDLSKKISFAQGNELLF